MSNLGMKGVRQFTAIINPPQVIGNIVGFPYIYCNYIGMHSCCGSSTEETGTL